MGGAGMLSVAIVLPMMGARIDQLGAGAALQFVGGLGVVLAVIFGGLMVWRGNLLAPVVAHFLVNAVNLRRLTSRPRDSARLGSIEGDKET